MHFLYLLYLRNTYEYNGVKYKVTTCIKFKGLEADAIEMLVLDRSSFAEKRRLNFMLEHREQKFDWILCVIYLQRIILK